MFFSHLLRLQIRLTRPTAIIHLIPTTAKLYLSQTISASGREIRFKYISTHTVRREALTSNQLCY